MYELCSHIKTLCCQGSVCLSLSTCKRQNILTSDQLQRIKQKKKNSQRIASSHYLIPVQVSACLGHPLHPDHTHIHTHIHTCLNFKEVTLCKGWFHNVIQRQSNSSQITADRAVSTVGEDANEEQTYAAVDPINHPAVRNNQFSALCFHLSCSPFIWSHQDTDGLLRE